MSKLKGKRAKAETREDRTDRTVRDAVDEIDQCLREEGIDPETGKPIFRLIKGGRR